MPAGDGFLERMGRCVPVRAVVANSRYTSATASKLFPDAPLHVIRYPVLPAEQSDRAAVRSALGIAPDELIILQVSRLQQWKGQLLHLSALRRLKSGRRWRAWFVGGASRGSEVRLLEDMKKASATLASGRVEFLGERADVPRLMRAADLFCQPNLGPEPFGIVFVEALSAGVPVVTTRMGGALEIVDESVGLAVDPNPEAVAAALDRLLEDDALRARLSAAGPARAASLCGPEACVRSLMTVLEKHGLGTADTRWD